VIHKPYFLIIGVFLALVVWSKPVEAHLAFPPYPYDIHRDGLFVAVPALVGAAVLAVPGAVVGGVICVPGAIGPGFSGEILDCAGAGAIVSGVIGSAIVGAPFFIVKWILWDLPRAAPGLKEKELPPL
jgi:hypothetical protein